MPEKVTQAKSDNPIPAWRKGGPLSPEQRKYAKAMFIDALEEEGNVSNACEHARIHPDSAYRWRKADKSFAKAWETAIERSNDVIRSEIFRRAVKGVETHVVSQGKVVYVAVTNDAGKPVLDEDDKPTFEPLIEKKYSDSLMSLLAKSRMEEFRDKNKTELTGKVEVQRNPNLARLTNEELDQLAELLNKASERQELADDASSVQP